MSKMYGHAKEARRLDVSTVLGELCPVFLHIILVLNPVTRHYACLRMG